MEKLNLIFKSIQSILIIYLNFTLKNTIFLTLFYNIQLQKKLKIINSLYF